MIRTDSRESVYVGTLFGSAPRCFAKLAPCHRVFPLPCSDSLHRTPPPSIRVPERLNISTVYACLSARRYKYAPLRLPSLHTGFVRSPPCSHRFANFSARNENKGWRRRGARVVTYSGIRSRSSRGTIARMDRVSSL